MKKNFCIISNLFIFTSIFAPLNINAQTVNFMPTELIAEPGEQKTNNISSGTTESLRISTSSTFGSNTNVSTTEGFTISSKSTLRPIQSTIVGTFGSAEGKMSVDVGNVKEDISGKHNETTASSTFDFDVDDGTLTQGFSTIEGITSQVNLDIDPLDTVTEVEIDDIGEATDSMKTANGAANQNLNNALSVDISNSTFNSSFSQAF